MRIGIFTLPLHANYGGILQAYALQTVLERMGHEVVVITKERHAMNKLSIWECYYKYLKRLIKKVLIDPRMIVFQEKKNQIEYPIVSKKINAFIDKYIHTCYTEDLATLSPNDFDAIVVGSDQIWRPLYFKMWSKDLSFAFLGFAKEWNIKRFAYAASFGVDSLEFPEQGIAKYRELIKIFDGVSVREDSGIDLCRKYLGIEAVQVLDPTMLLGKEDYERLFKAAGSVKSDGDLLCYVLDDNPAKIGLIKRVAHERLLSPFYVNAKSLTNSQCIEERIHPSVEEWLRGFYDAKFVITDSFHACVFSILFNKPFIVVGNKERGMSRFHSLLKMFGLESHLLADVSEYNPELSYAQDTIVKEKLDSMRKVSMDFISKINS